MIKIFSLSGIALVIFAMVISGCTTTATAQGPAVPVVTTGQAAHADLTVAATTPTPAPTSQRLDVAANQARELMQCERGIGGLDYCLNVGKKSGISNEEMELRYCRNTNDC